MNASSTITRKEQNPAKGIIDGYRTELQGVFTLLELGELPSGPQELVEVTQEWAKGDHWAPDNKVRLFGLKREKLLGLFDSMGLVEPILPPDGEYDHIVVVGALARANLARLEFVKRLIDERHISLAEQGQIFFLGGQRARNPKEVFDFGRQVRMIGSCDEFPIVAEQVEHLATPEGRYVAFGSEYDLGQLAVIACFGDAVEDSSEVIGHDKQDAYTKIKLRLSKRAMTNVNILNSPAVHRTHGQARHTTSSSAEELLSRFGASIKQDARLLIVSNNPHIRRIGLDLAGVTKSHGRSDIQIFSCGPGAAPSAPAEMFLGEIARLIYQETER